MAVILKRDGVTVVEAADASESHPLESLRQPEARELFGRGTGSRAVRLR